MVDFQTQARTMRLAGPEDRALLGSNPSAAAGDGDISRSSRQAGAPAPKMLFLDVLVQKRDKPIIVRSHSTVTKIKPFVPTGLPFGNISRAASRFVRGVL